MYRIVKKEALKPTVILYEIEAPMVAKKAEPGQFIILRVDENGERIPITIHDYDREKGTVTIIVQTVGGETKFACVDGPDFDGQKVDWDLAVKRNQMYHDFEVRKHEEVCNLFKQEVK